MPTSQSVFQAHKFTSLRGGHSHLCMGLVAVKELKKLTTPYVRTPYVVHRTIALVTQQM